MTKHTIDMTPSWAGQANMIAMIIARGTDEGRESIIPEVQRMGQIIDQLQARVAELEAARETPEDAPADLPWVEADSITDTYRGRFLSDGLPDDYDTVLGYLARMNPWALQADLWDPEATQRDGFWCKHRASERCIEVVKVEAPEVLQEQGIHEVNAYPVSLLAERLGD